MQEIDITQPFRKHPPKPDFVIEGFEAGTFGVLLGKRGTGKSSLALQIAVTVASPARVGRGLYHLTCWSPKPGRVVYFSSRDTSTEIINRLHAVCDRSTKPAERKITENLSVIEPHKPIDLNTDGDFDRVVQRCAGARLVVFDSIYDFDGLEPSSCSDAHQIALLLHQIAAQSGAGVLCLSSMCCGSATQLLLDMARWRATISYVQTARAKEYKLRLSLQPSSVSAHPKMYWLTRRIHGEVGIVPDLDTDGDEAQDPDSEDRFVILDD